MSKHVKKVGTADARGLSEEVALFTRKMDMIILTKALF